MSLLMMLAASSSDAVTRTFSANTTFVVPAGVTQISSLVGHGAAGAPGGTAPAGYQVITETWIDFEDGTQAHFGPTAGAITRGEPTPDDYCTTEPYGSNGATETVCYAFVDVPEEEYGPTTGASTTGFGKTFPGGTGGPAPTTTFSNVTVTPGGSYAIKVPSGGSLTITYLKPA